VATRIGEETADIFECTTCRQAAPGIVDGNDSGEAPAFDPVKLKQRQIADFAVILEKGKRGTPAFKSYKKAEEDDIREEEELLNSAPPETNNNAPPEQFPYGNIYFYHPDHLGSSTFLTDANGMPYQFYLNLPFGETMLEQHSLTEDCETPYKFNGKELDTETGFYYYSARYYDPRTSIFLSTDPLMEEYQSVNPYVYSLDNPVNLIDPTGMGPDPWYKRAWNWTKKKVHNMFSDDDKYVPINKSSVEVGVPKLESMGGGGSAYTPYCWQVDGKSYTRFNETTLLVRDGALDNGTYQFLLPQDFGSWGEKGSDGHIWIGCMSCHSPDGAYTGAVYNSAERTAGLAGALFLQVVTGSLIGSSGSVATAENLTPLNLGSTGRTTAINLTEKLAMEEIMANPNMGGIIERMAPLNDARWLGWRKMQYIHNGLDGSQAVIHFNGKWVNGNYKQLMTLNMYSHENTMH